MPSPTKPRALLPLLAVAGVGLVGACARQGAPPGGPQDRRPPVVIATEPDTFAVLTKPFDGPVVFRFDERISERPSTGTLDDAVLVSPHTGDVRVSHGRTTIEVKLDGGFEPGKVYRVTLLPVVKDLFNNTMMDPVDLVFSTGAEIVPSAIAGEAWDRITGRGMEGAVVTATSEDSTVYLARTDSGGIYAFRYLVPGRYLLTAFEDRNRNDEADLMEPQGTRTDSLSGPDTLITNIPVLQPDTTPAHLASATMLDSIRVVLLFDDYLDPDAPVSAIQVGIAREGRANRPIVRTFQEWEYAAYVEATRADLARRDSLMAAFAARARDTMTVPDTTVRADTAEIDTTRAAVDSARGRPVVAARPARPAGPPDLPPLSGGAPRAPAARGAAAGGAPATGPEGETLPGRRLVVQLRQPPLADTTYQVTVEGVVNINGLPDGGGETDLVWKAPADTAAARDSAAVPDTVPAADTVPPDTALVFLRGRKR
jgi:hypothetical protein